MRFIPLPQADDSELKTEVDAPSIVLERPTYSSPSVTVFTSASWQKR